MALMTKYYLKYQCIPTMLQDGAEYDEYGNRQKYGSGTLPRGYDRGLFTSTIQKFFLI